MDRKGRGGFTLIETIFSTLFISLTVLAIVNLFPGAYLSVKKSESQLQSDYLANSILNEVRSMPFRLLEVNPADPNPGPGPGPSGFELEQTGEPFAPQTIDGTEYRSKVTIYEVADADWSLVRGVRVEVTYRTGRAELTHNVYETYVHSFKR